MSEFGKNVLNFGAGVVKDSISQTANGLIQQAFAEHNRKRNYYWNEKAAEQADKRQREQYEDLYSPNALLSQYAAAGLSPSMMMSGGQSAVGQSSAQGNQSAGVTGAYPSAQPTLDPLYNAQLENVKADTEEKKERAENLDKDTELKGQEIINLMTEDKNNRAKFRLINAEADLAELEYSTDLQTAQATIRSAYANAEKAANQARSAAVHADLDEATFDCAYQMAYANLDNVLTDTALAKSEINVNKAQIKEIAERIRNSQWETWSMEKEQNRKDAIFQLDKAKLESEIKRWAAEQNIELLGMKLEMVSDLVGYVCNFATCGMSNVTEIRKTEMYNQTKKELANKPTTTHTQNYRVDKKGNKVVTGGSYKKTD